MHFIVPTPSVLTCRSPLGRARDVYAAIIVREGPGCDYARHCHSAVLPVLHLMAGVQTRPRFGCTACMACSQRYPGDIARPLFGGGGGRGRPSEVTPADVTTIASQHRILPTVPRRGDNPASATDRLELAALVTCSLKPAAQYTIWP